MWKSSCEPACKAGGERYLWHDFNVECNAQYKMVYWSVAAADYYI